MFTELFGCFFIVVFVRGAKAFTFQPNTTLLRKAELRSVCETHIILRSR